MCVLTIMPLHYVVLGVVVSRDVLRSKKPRTGKAKNVYLR